MQVTLTIIRYPGRYIYFALLAMAVHRFPLWLNKDIPFFKLLGCGKNGAFDKHPDWQQWGIFAVSRKSMGESHPQGININSALYGPLIGKWFRFFNCETWTVFLEPLEGHGSWDGQQPFGSFSNNATYNGPVAILTRATIRLSKLKAFWEQVDGLAADTKKAEGFISSIGIGELPFIKQATFSLWQSMAHMKNFAYRAPRHVDVIKKTRDCKWYSEDMLIRFKPIRTSGSLRGADPLKGML